MWFLPVVQWLPRDERSWFSEDAIASVSIWTVLVPQALAYSSIAGVPVQYGLYTAFAALLGYALFGTSRYMVQVRGGRCGRGGGSHHATCRHRGVGHR